MHMLVANWLSDAYSDAFSDAKFNAIESQSRFTRWLKGSSMANTSLIRVDTITLHHMNIIAWREKYRPVILNPVRVFVKHTMQCDT